MLLAIAGIVYGVAHGTNNAASGTATPTTPPITPTPTPSAQQRAETRPVDGVQCGATEQIAYHIHQHLMLYDHGQSLLVPAEIGIPGGEQNPFCFYWIHVHVATPNIIHVESPIEKTYNLGNFFDIWKVTKATTIPSGDSYVLALENAAKAGQVTAFLNGKRWTKSYRAIPLTAHAVITVEIGKPVVPPKPFTNWQGL